jgi:hypothetical protein
VIASAVTTPHPPAVVRTTTLGPAGSGWVANVAAASNASSTDMARVIAGRRQAPSNTASSAASAPVWLAAAFAAPGGGTALDQHERLAGATDGEPVESARRR